MKSKKETKKHVRRRILLGIALFYAVLGIVLLAACFAGLVLLCSAGAGTFNNYNEEFSIWKFILYLILVFLSVVAMAASAYLSGYGQDYIAKRWHEKRGRCL